jgi:hypothetical protein
MRLGRELDSPAMDSIRSTLTRLASWEPSNQLRKPLATALFVVGFLGHLARRRGVLSHPALFGEDGQIFFLGSHRNGVSSIKDAYNGYLLVGTRCLAFFATLLPIAWTPTTYAILAALVAVGSCAIAMRFQLMWAFGGWLPRAAVFGALLLLPQVAETHATLTNIAWWGGIGLLLIGLSDDPLAWWGRAAEAAFVLIVVLTGPIGIVLAPIVVWRWWRVRSNWTAALTAVWAGAALLQVVVLRGQNRKVESVKWGADLGGVFVRRWFGPFTTGSDYVQSHLAGPPWSRNAWLLTLLFAGGLLVVAVRGRDRGAGIVLLALGSLQILAGFVAMGPLAHLLPDRYTVGASAAIILVAASARPSDWPTRVAQVLLIIWALIGWPRNIAVPERKAPSFAKAAACLEQADTTCRVPAVPEPFSFEVTPADR